MKGNGKRVARIRTVIINFFLFIHMSFGEY